MNHIKYHVKGMHCASCEVLIERHLKKIAGVHHVNVNRAANIVSIDFEGDITLQQFQDALTGTEYTLLPFHENIPAEQYKSPEHSPHFTGTQKRLLEIGAIAIIIFGAYFLLTSLDIIPKNFGLQENMSYGFVFLIGLIASTSTCLAVSGGLLLAIAAKYNEKHPHVAGWQKFKPHIAFNIGRIVSYTLLGGLVGILGSAISLSSTMNGVITLIASTAMVIIGIQLLHIFPALNKIHLKMPKWIAHKIYDKSTHHTTSHGHTSSFLFGASTFFLPCGFTQALQLYVLAKGSFTAGALTMLFFSLGTLPSLAAVGVLTSFIKGNFYRHIMTASAVLIIILGSINITNGLVLAGIYQPQLTKQATGISTQNPYFQKLSQRSSEAELAPLIDGKQVVGMSVDGLEYFPAHFKIRKGIPVEWIIDATKASGCAHVITIPKLGITAYLPASGTKTISFTAHETGFLKFHCTMAMTTPGAGFEVIEE